MRQRSSVRAGRGFRREPHREWIVIRRLAEDMDFNGWPAGDVANGGNPVPSRRRTASTLAL